MNGRPNPRDPDPLATLLTGDFGSMKADLDDIEEPSDAELAALEEEVHEDEDEDEDEDAAVGAGPGGMEALLRAIMGQGRAADSRPAGPRDHLLDDEGSATALVEFLVRSGHLELEPGFLARDISEGVAAILARGMAPSVLAAALSAWLLRQDEVAELYIDDGGLEAILIEW